MSIGSLKIQTYMNNIANPVDKANIKVTLYDSNNIVKDVISLKTDDSGIAEINEIQTPPLELSLNENAEGRPYGICDILVEKDGYSQTFIEGCQLFGDEEAIQPVDLKMLNRNVSSNNQSQEIKILPNRLYGDYPPKIPEAEEHLLKLKNLIKENQPKMGEPLFMMVITGTEMAYKTEGNVLVVPIGCLKD